MHGRSRFRAVLGAVAFAGVSLAGCGGGSHPVAGSSFASVASRGAATPSASPAAPSGPASPSPAVDTRPVLIVHDATGAVSYDGREPSMIAFSRDSSNIVEHLSWSSWGSGGAVGHGTLGLNTCEPNCAQGTVRQVPATVEMSGVVGGHFTVMTEKSGAILQHYRYPSDWASGAS